MDGEPIRDEGLKEFLESLPAEVRERARQCMVESSTLAQLRTLYNGMRDAGFNDKQAAGMLQNLMLVVISEEEARRRAG